MTDHDHRPCRASACEPLSVTCPSQEKSHDDAGRITVASDGVTSYATIASPNGYAPHGAVAEMKLGNERFESADYNSRLQPTAMRLGTVAGGSEFWQISLGYGTSNNNGNLLTQTITVPDIPALSQSYTYDGISRIKTANEAGSWSRSYDYDGWGNRWVNGANHMLHMATPIAPTDFEVNNRLAAGAYDAAGNLTGHPFLIGTATYDAENRQKAFSEGSSATYHYDGAGRRVKKAVSGGATIIYVYDALGNLAAEYSTAPDSNLVAGTTYRTLDHLGSTRVITDQTGNVRSRRDYFPFGEEIAATAAFGNRQLVTDGQPTSTYNEEVGIDQKFTGQN